MKKSAAFALALLALCVSTSHAELEWGIGAKAGVGFPQLTGDVPDGAVYNTKAGMLLGGVVKMGVNDWFSAQGEINYTVKGTEWVVAGAEGGNTFSFVQDITLTYLEIPITAMLTIPVHDRIMPYVYAGPAMGFNVTANTRIDTTIVNGGLPVFSAYSAQIGNAKTVEFSGAIGGGLGYKISDLWVTLDLRYSKSFSGVFDDLNPADVPPFSEKFSVVDPVTGEAPDLKNELWTVTITFVGLL